MRQTKSVAEFMGSFFFGPREKQCFVFGQTIKLLLQTMDRHQRHGAADLGLAKDKGEDRNEEINCGDAQDLFPGTAAELFQPGEQIG